MYAADVCPQRLVGPVIAPGNIEFVVNASVLAVPVPQTFVAATEILPEAGMPLAVTAIEVVPAPPVIVIQLGTVHV